MPDQKYIMTRIRRDQWRTIQDLAWRNRRSATAELEELLREKLERREAKELFGK